MQTRLHSLIESLSNIALGYGVAIGAQLAIFPLFNIHIPLRDNLAIGAFFTGVSLCRSYILRRVFNKISGRMDYREYEQKLEAEFLGR